MSCSVDRDLATLPQLVDIATHGLHDRFATVGICIANIELQDDAAGHAVHSPRMDVAGPDGGDGIDHSSGERVLFHRENQLGGCAQRIAAVGHQQRSGMPAEASNREPVARRRCDAGDDTDRQPFAFEQRSLLDVQFYPGVIVVRREHCGSQRTSECRCRANLGQGACSIGRLIGFAQRVGTHRIESTGENARADATDAKACRLLRREQQRAQSTAVAALRYA